MNHCQWKAPCLRPVHGYGYCGYHLRVMHLSGAIRVDRMRDAALVAERIAIHKARGRTYRQLADLCGVSKDTITGLANGQQRLRTSTHDKVMNAPLPPTVTGTLRRVHALMRMGFTKRHIAADADVPYPALHAALHRRRFTAVMMVAIADTYDRLDRGPSRITAAKAARAGYPSPMAWEGIDIDDPAAQADVGASRAAVPFPTLVEWAANGELANRGGKLGKRAREEAIRRFGDKSPEWIAAKIGCSSRTVMRVRAKRLTAVVHSEMSSSLNHQEAA